ncbi:hypothetical protein GCM10022236_06740 [Microlunatus ginsengisoli]|uniref:DUF3039 domain-containing protein n=1 Tax=Microlunatus ginsengisoli TaxID=363863 RepID=A0ABP6ZF55_9ACTN
MTQMPTISRRWETPVAGAAGRSVAAGEVIGDQSTTSSPVEVNRETVRVPAATGVRERIAGAAGVSRLSLVSQQTAPGAKTIVDERTETRPDYRVEEGDHERFSHYVPRDKLTEAMVMGTPVVALCGKVWVPSRDPERFPVCPECKEIWESLPQGGDD